jgi:hypothetical protein
MASLTSKEFEECLRSGESTSGNKLNGLIYFIKFMREISGITLKEAKEFAELPVCNSYIKYGHDVGMVVLQAIKRGYVVGLSTSEMDKFKENIDFILENYNRIGYDCPILAVSEFASRLVMLKESKNSIQMG